MNALVLAQATDFQTIEFDLPESTLGILGLVVGLIALFGITAWVSLRDTRFLNGRWRTFLLLLRAAVLLLVLMILLNPQERTQTTEIERSRVSILLDTSSSMAYPATDEEAENGQTVTRTEAVQKTLIESGLLEELSKTHNIGIYTFDTALRGPEAVISESGTTFSLETTESDDTVETEGPAIAAPTGTRVNLEDAELTDDEISQKWTELLQPDGSETRLGESLNELVGKSAGNTLSGLLVVTDGRLNAGLEAEIARLRAARSETRLVTIGVGSRKPQINLRMAGMRSPTDVHRGDPFDISVVVQGANLAEQNGSVTLFQQSPGSDGKDRKKVDSQDFQFEETEVPVELKFQQQISVPGEYEYVAVAELKDGTLVELTMDDNQRHREVEITDRKQKVLIISSGPMRDYRFVRNMLFRHSGVDSDVWLQTVQGQNVGFVSQEATQVLTEFPKTLAELNKYDVIIAFDANWDLLNAEQQEFLNGWVDKHRGGMIFVAGELFTPELARDREKFKDIAVLYPVIPGRMLAELRITQRADRASPVRLTPEGRTLEFLQIADATGRSSVDLWKEFDGIFRSYPVQGIRAGATVLAEYNNPRARTQDGQPPFLASQLYGQGKTLFVSSAETWRLRAISAEGHQRFWTSMLRYVGEGRRSQGQTLGMLLLDRSEASPGQTVTIRAQLFNNDMSPLNERDFVSISIVDDQGRPIDPPHELRRDPLRDGQFVNTFRPSRPGSCRVTLAVPNSDEVLQATVDVSTPDLESQSPSQDVALLTALPDQTGGQYLAIEEVVAQLADLLPDRSQPIQIDEQRVPLWDNDWLMYLMAGLLAIEWITRRMFRLS